MDKFLQMYDLSRLNKEEIENIINSNKIELIILRNKIPGPETRNKIPGPVTTSEVNSTKYLNELTPILNKRFSKKILKRRNASELIPQGL